VKCRYKGLLASLQSMMISNVDKSVAARFSCQDESIGRNSLSWLCRLGQPRRPTSSCQSAAAILISPCLMAGPGDPGISNKWVNARETHFYPLNCREGSGEGRQGSFLSREISKSECGSVRATQKRGHMNGDGYCRCWKSLT
jgi:hypothetical protein